MSAPISKSSPSPGSPSEGRAVRRGAGVLSYLSAGFLMGSGGELTVKAMQGRLIGKK